MKGALKISKHDLTSKPEVIRYTIIDSSIGSILIASSGKGVCCITLGDHPELLLGDLHHRFKNAEIIHGNETFKGLVSQVVGFVKSPQLGLELPLDVRGTEFQQRVWQALRKIPSGSTASYADIARMIGSPSSIRAVAGACAANPISLAIPCHRILRSDGHISGYRWGIERKRILLAREAFT
jgi:AraC family transcriptional regulator of adaptative response/methylated-DNA-[protein]-cysteine methyltransferase